MNVTTPLLESLTKTKSFQNDDSAVSMMAIYHIIVKAEFLKMS